MTRDKSGLINELLKTGKNQSKSWRELAYQYNFSTEEEARACWKWYRKTNKQLVESKKELIEAIDEYEAKINNINEGKM